LWLLPIKQINKVYLNQLLNFVLIKLKLKNFIELKIEEIPAMCKDIITISIPGSDRYKISLRGG